MIRGTFTVTALDDGQVHVILTMDNNAVLVSWNTDAEMAEDLGSLLIAKAKQAKELTAFQRIGENDG